MKSEVKMSPTKFTHFIALIILLIISAACSSNIDGDQEPQIEAALVGENESIEQELFEVSEILNACDINAQEEAMASGMAPNWKSLPLSACYQLSLNLQEEMNQYDGRASVTYTNQTGEVLNDLVFRLYPNSKRVYGGELTVTSANVDGAQVDYQDFLSDKTGLRLTLDESIDPGETVVVELEFEGELSDGLENSPGAYGIFNFEKDKDLVSMANWYPILAVREDGEWLAEPVVGVGDAVVSEISLYLVDITAIHDMEFATTGSLIEIISSENVDTLRFASGPTREFTIVGSPDFVIKRAELGEVHVNHWGLAGGEKRWEEGMQATIDSLSVFNERFGPYPYEEIDVVSVPLQLASGVEYPGLFMMKDGLYFPDKEQPYLLSTIIAHEVAHQWWYAMVGNNVLEHPWQDEALTTFSSLLYLEEYQPRVYDGTVNYFRSIADEIESKRDDTRLNQPVRSFENEPTQYSPVIYSKGAIFFVELRKKIGEQAFFQALKAYFDRNKYYLTPPDRILDEFEKACQCDLSQFYKEWGVMKE